MLDATIYNAAISILNANDTDIATHSLADLETAVDLASPQGTSSETRYTMVDVLLAEQEALLGRRQAFASFAGTFQPRSFSPLAT